MLTHQPWNLFLDDIRDPSYLDNTSHVGKEWFIARSVKDAISLISQLGMPQFISFDHDLGWEDLLPIEGTSILAASTVGQEMPSGFDFTKWLVHMSLDKAIKFPKGFSFYVHSANPVGAENIRVLLNSYLAHLKENE